MGEIAIMAYIMKYKKLTLEKAYSIISEVKGIVYLPTEYEKLLSKLIPTKQHNDRDNRVAMVDMDHGRIVPARRPIEEPIDNSYKQFDNIHDVFENSSEKICSQVHETNNYEKDSIKSNSAADYEVSNTAKNQIMRNVEEVLGEDLEYERQNDDEACFPSQDESKREVRSEIRQIPKNDLKREIEKNFENLSKDDSIIESDNEIYRKNSLKTSEREIEKDIEDRKSACRERVYVLV